MMVAERGRRVARKAALPKFLRVLGQIAGHLVGEAENLIV
jgi:hypothetical protein